MLVEDRKNGNSTIINKVKAQMMKECGELGYKCWKYVRKHGDRYVCQKIRGKQ